jgi:SAM-dependent methyltransferase
MPARIRGIAQTLPDGWKRRIRRATATPPLRTARIRSAGRLVPVSRNWGLERGTPVDRHYIDTFLADHAGDIRGSVLEVGESVYTARFGGHRVVRSDILDPDQAHPEATVIADLEQPDALGTRTWDCIICTQVLGLIYELDDAIANLARALKPGGTLLMTLPGIGAISHPDADIWGDFWRFTPAGVDELVRSAFPDASVSIEGHGNVLTAVAFLHGLAAEELKPGEFDATDERFPLVVTVRATNGSAPGAT